MKDLIHVELRIPILTAYKLRILSLILQELSIIETSKSVQFG